MDVRCREPRGLAFLGRPLRKMGGLLDLPGETGVEMERWEAEFSILRAGTPIGSATTRYLPLDNLPAIQPTMWWKEFRFVPVPAWPVPVDHYTSQVHVVHRHIQTMDMQTHMVQGVRDAPSS